MNWSIRFLLFIFCLVTEQHIDHHKVDEEETTKPQSKTKSTKSSPGE